MAKAMKINQLLAIGLILTIISLVAVMVWGMVRVRVLGILGLDNFYPIVSKEVADYREKDKKQNLGVLEPDFAGLHREFAGFRED